MNQNLLIVMMQAGFFLGPLPGGWLLSPSGYAAFFNGLAAASFVALILMMPVGRLVERENPRQELSSTKI